MHQKGWNKDYGGLTMRMKLNVNTKLDKKMTVKQMQAVLFKSMLKMHELATINCPVDTGRLRNSIILDPASPGYTNYILSDGVEYGIDVEYGTKPHYLTSENLKGWARRVLGDENIASAVAWKIAHKGTEAQPFFRPALDQVKQVWVFRFANQEFNKNNNV
jgi:hypothetical protein